jgi:hypothetical protein
MSEETSVTDPDGDPGTPVSVSPPAAPRSFMRRRITLIAGTAVAIVAATTTAIVLSASQGPTYAPLGNVCALVSRATIAKYLPGQADSHRDQGSCQWFGDTGTGDGLDVSVSVLAGATEARGAFTEIVRFSEQKSTANGETQTVTGKQAVTGLGDQATALLGTISGGPLQDTRVGLALLFVRSGNAVIQVNRTTGTPRAAAASLPGVIAVARVILAALPRA